MNIRTLETSINSAVINKISSKPHQGLPQVTSRMCHWRGSKTSSKITDLIIPHQLTIGWDSEKKSEMPLAGTESFSVVSGLFCAWKPETICRGKENAFRRGKFDRSVTGFDHLVQEVLSQKVGASQPARRSALNQCTMIFQSSTGFCRLKLVGSLYSGGRSAGYFRRLWAADAWIPLKFSCRRGCQPGGISSGV